jgi:hypothetical protein
MRRIRFYLKAAYRLSLDINKQEDLMWADLKKTLALLNLKSGNYEKEKYAVIEFSISADQRAIFHYVIYDGYYTCRVKILEDFTPELTTDIFVLASHFNNLMRLGLVSVDVESQFVEYYIKRDLLVPLIFNGEIHDQMVRHLETSKLIFSGFQRLVIENEAPAIIIADLIKESEESKNEQD